MAESYLSRNGYRITDCVTCGAQCPIDSSSADGHSAWARRHADENPGHSVHVTTERTRVYRANRPDGSTEQ